MKAVEFTTELSGAAVLEIPKDAAVRLPKTGKARVIILTDESDEAEWSRLTAEQFLNGYAPGDAIYDKE
jgi:hypothetical protein